MAVYETVFMARQDLSDNQVKDLTDGFVKIIEKNSGKILKQENWGLRTLAYKINKSRKAHYVLIEFEAPGATAIELERLMRLNEDVMRALTLRLDEPTKGPSAIMDRSDRGDRPERGDRKPRGDYNRDDSRPRREAA